MIRLTGVKFAELMIGMDIDELELAPDRPRTYPTNYFWQAIYEFRVYDTRENTCRATGARI